MESIRVKWQSGDLNLLGASRVLVCIASARGMPKVTALAGSVKFCGVTKIKIASVRAGKLVQTPSRVPPEALSPNLHISRFVLDYLEIEEDRRS